MTELEDNFDTKTEIQRLRSDFEPHNLSKKICEAIKSQKDIDIAIKGVIQDALEKDIDTRKVVKDLIKESRKENVWAFGIAIVQYILSFIAGGGLVYFFKYLP